MGLVQAVGSGQANLPADVRQVQQLLNARARATVVAVTGWFDQATVNCLARFQERELNMRPPTGRVDPDSPTWLALNGQSGPAAESPLDRALLALESDSVAFAQRFINDAGVRANYVREAQRFSAEVRDQVARGELTAQQGAQRATDMRNALLEAARLRNSDIGRAVSEAEKATGLGFTQLLERYATRLFGRSFAQLTAAQQDHVFAEVIRAAGRPNPRFTNLSRNLGRVGKGLLIVSIAFASYEVMTSNRPGREAARQGVGIGAGLGGSIAGGALAGLACGPGAPICVGIGALVGGIAFAVGADVTFTWLWR
jgi:putative peptidoglycan binding protein